MIRRIRRDDRGSSLVIALAFLMVFSLWLTSTLTATESGMHISQTMRVQPKRLYAADAAIEQVIQKIRYEEAEGRWDDAECGTPDGAPIQFQNPAQTVYVECVPDGNSGRGEEGESSPPVGIIALSNGLLNEFAYQQYGNAIIRLDGGLYSSTPLLFQNGNTCGANSTECQQLNVCPRNKKTVRDARLTRNSPVVSSATAGFTLQDIGVPIVGNGIPTGAIIAGDVGPTVATMSRLATANRTDWPVTFREDYPRLQSHCHIPTTAEDPLGEHRRKGKITAVPRVPGASAESCDQTLIVALQFNCDGAYVPDPIGSDPNYPVDKYVGFANQIVPPCGDPLDARPVTLTPGRYTNAAALTALTTGCDKLIWFTPGTYYFDFDDNPVWTIGNTSKPSLTVVGGEKTWNRDPFRACVSYNNSTRLSTVTIQGAGSFFPSDAGAAYINAGYNLPYKAKIVSVNGSKTATFSGQPLTNNFCGLYTVSPNRIAPTFLDWRGSLCNPATDEDHPGVEFVFGKESRMVVTDGKTELCSPVEATRQQIAIYGVKVNQGQLRAQSGCIIAQPYTPSGGSGCAMVKAPQGSKAAFIVHGTIYSPNAAIDLSLQGVGYQVVSRGIIARVVALAVSPSSLFTEPLIFSPDFGSIPGAPRKVALTACLNALCESGGTPKLRAIVRFMDSDEFGNAGIPGYKVLIDSWAVL